MRVAEEGAAVATIDLEQNALDDAADALGAAERKLLLAAGDCVKREDVDAGGRDVTESATTSQSVAQPAAPGVPFYPYYVLALLFLGYVLNFADRQVVSILAQDIKRDLYLHDWQLGILTGPAIALFYAILGVPLAYIADRVHRVRFLVLCLAAWSVLTAFGGLARNLWQLALTRMGVSIAEGGGTPISASLLADYFPPEHRATAMGIYSAATSVGVLFGFALGGVVNDLVGWRWAMAAAGTPGLLVGLIILLTLREPKRGAADPAGAQHHKSSTLSLWSTMVHLWAIPEYRRMVLACAGANMGVYILLAWGPSVALRSFDVTTGQVGLIMGAGFAVLGVVTLTCAGMLADYLNRRDRALPVAIMALAQFLAAPLMIATLFAPTLTTYMIALSLAYACTVSNSVVAWSITQNYTPADMRASAAALMVLVFNLFGLGLGPPLVGFISDTLTSTYGAASLRYALALVAATSTLTALLLFFWVVPVIRGDRSQ